MNKNNGLKRNQSGGRPQQAGPRKCGAREIVAYIIDKNGQRYQNDVGIPVFG